ncbi:RICIN domain-containing protein [Streptomyces lavendulae]|uniref:RICIN domain-containing protein n=1 Tax=Streptomyces lavendulae TaxID=1914 RepID=UPI002553F666|nr:RICIN domain-containing protein [Streptomyces lavendulae]
MKAFGGVSVAAGLLVALMPGQASAEIGGSRIINERSGLCLEVADWRTDNGAPVRQWPCSGGANQRWGFQQAELGRWRLVNVHSGKCLEVADWRKDPGAPVRQWDCTGQVNQRWDAVRSDSVADAPHEIRNVNSGQCLEIGGWSTAWGAPANQWNCGAQQPNQVWHYFAVA